MKAVGFDRGTGECKLKRLFVSVSEAEAAGEWKAGSVMEWAVEHGNWEQRVRSGHPSLFRCERRTET